MTRPISIALVGAGAISRRHLEAMASLSDCRMVALVDPAPESVDLAAAKGVDHFASLETLLAGARPDGVIVATPNPQHVPQALQCLERGLPVLVEKPIADSLEGALSLTEASERSGLPVLVGHHRRHNPIVRQARQVLRSGALGSLLVVSATFLVRKADDYFDAPWRRETGGGPILINLIHEIDCLRFIAGEIAGVQAMTSNHARGFAVEDTAALLLRFRDGALGSVVLSDGATAPWSWELTAGERTSYNYPQTGQDCYLFAGSEGSMAVPSLRLWRYEGAKGWEAPISEECLSLEYADPLIAQLAHFAAVIRGEEDPLITARDATRTLEATLGVRQAAESGREVVLEV